MPNDPQADKESNQNAPQTLNIRITVRYTGVFDAVFAVFEEIETMHMAHDLLHQLDN